MSANGKDYSPVERRPDIEVDPLVSYPQAEADRVRVLLDDRAHDRRHDHRGEWLAVAAAVKQYCWKRETLTGYEQECPCLSGGKLVPEWFTDPLSASKQLKKFYLVADLDAIQTARTDGFVGYYETHEGRRISLTAASQRSGLSLERLWHYTERCPLLPGGKLRTVRMRRPNLTGKKEHTILVADLDRLTRAIDDAEKLGSQAGEWETLSEILRRYKVRGHPDNARISNLLKALHNAGQLNRNAIAKLYSQGNGMIRTRLHYNTVELGRFLAGRGIVTVAREFESNPNAVLSTEKSTVATAQRRGRGRPVGAIDEVAAQRNRRMRTDHEAKKFPSIAALARHYRVDRGQASRIVNGKE